MIKNGAAVNVIFPKSTFPALSIDIFVNISEEIKKRESTHKWIYTSASLLKIKEK